MKTRHHFSQRCKSTHNFKKQLGLHVYYMTLICTTYLLFFLLCSMRCSLYFAVRPNTALHMRYTYIQISERPAEITQKHSLPPRNIWNLHSLTTSPCWRHKESEFHKRCPATAKVLDFVILLQQDNELTPDDDGKGGEKHTDLRASDLWNSQSHARDCQEKTTHIYLFSGSFPS